jgi:hypothetical protein
MARRFLRRSAKFEFRPWMLKQVQHDETWRSGIRPNAVMRRQNPDQVWDDGGGRLA